MNHTSHVSHPHTTECLHRPKEKTTFHLLTSAIEKTSAIALGIFAAYISLELFVPFSFVGICIGIYSYFESGTSCTHAHSVSACAHGLLEQLTGVKLPALISLAANIAVTVCHIDHHATVFVPIIGISLGNWFGETSSHYGVLLYRKIACLSQLPQLNH